MSIPPTSAVVMAAVPLSGMESSKAQAHDDCVGRDLRGSAR